jgi:hypothetical protein
MSDSESDLSCNDVDEQEYFQTKKSEVNDEVLDDSLACYEVDLK